MLSIRNTVANSKLYLDKNYTEPLKSCIAELICQMHTIYSLQYVNKMIWH